MNQPTPPIQATRGAVQRKLRFLFETHHMTASELSEIIGVRRRTLQDLLDGKAEPTSGTLQTLCRHFKVASDYFDDVRSESSEQKSAASASSAAGSRPTASSTKKPAEALTLKTLAVRYQGLVELLIEKQVFSAAEYNEHIRRVEERSK